MEPVENCSPYIKNIHIHHEREDIKGGIMLDFPCGSEVKASACNEGDLGLIPGSGRSPREGNGNPLQYSCLENPMDGGDRWDSPWGLKEPDMTEQLH